MQKKVCSKIYNLLVNAGLFVAPLIASGVSTQALSGVSKFKVPMAGSLDLRALHTFGTVDGGGGQAIVCRDGFQGKILSAEVLDLFEGRIFYGLDGLLAGTNIDEILLSVARRWASVLQPQYEVEQATLQYRAELTRVQGIMRKLPPGIRLKPIDDAELIGAPESCRTEQLANYVDDQRLLIDGELWDALDAYQQAGLIAHEAVYRRERDGGAKNSRQARKIVAHLMSDSVIENVYEGLPVRSYFCTAGRGAKGPSSGFYVYQNPNWGDGAVVQFTHLFGKLLYGKTAAWVPKAAVPVFGLSPHGNAWSNFRLESPLEQLGDFQLGVEMHVDSGVVSTLYYLSDGATRRDRVECSENVKVRMAISLGTQVVRPVITVPYNEDATMLYMSNEGQGFEILLRVWKSSNSLDDVNISAVITSILGQERELIAKPLFSVSLGQTAQLKQTLADGRKLSVEVKATSW